MTDVEPIIEALLNGMPDGFRNTHLARASGLSRARVSQLLAARVQSGELKRVGDGRGPYKRPPTSGPPAGFARGAPIEGFWRDVARSCPEVGYVALCRLVTGELRTRRQVRSILCGCAASVRYLVADFEGIRAISEAAAHQLVQESIRCMCLRVEPINAEPTVARTLLRHLHFEYPTR